MGAYKHMSPVTQNLERCVGPSRCKFGKDGNESTPHYEMYEGKMIRLDENGGRSGKIVDPRKEVEDYNEAIFGGSFGQITKSIVSNYIDDLDDEDDLTVDKALNASRKQVPDLIKAQRYDEALTMLDSAEAVLVNAYNDYENSENDDDELASVLDRVRSQKQSLRMVVDTRALGSVNLSEEGFSEPKAMYEDINMQLGWMKMGDQDKKKVVGAMNTAWQLHHGQYRKSTDIPYITHPLSNMKRLIEYGVTDPDMLAAAALHDCVEDCSEHFVEKTERPKENHARTEMQGYIDKRFGKKTGTIVAAVSNEEHKDPNWTSAEKNANYVKHAKNQIEADFGAFMVKYSDFLDNAGTLTTAKFDDVNRQKKLAAKYKPLVKAFADAAKKHQSEGNYKISAHGHGMLVSELKRIQSELGSILAA